MNMEKHASKDDMIKNFENLLAKINALEVSAKDDYQRSVIKVLRMLTEGQIHSINEFDHLKKAIDLLTLQLFDVKTNHSFIRYYMVVYTYQLSSEQLSHGHFLQNLALDKLPSKVVPLNLHAVTSI